MNDSYSIKFNRQEGSLDISASDKNWVDSKIAEFKELLSASSVNPVTIAKTPAISGKTSSSTVKAKKTRTTTKSIKNTELAALLTKEIRNKLEAYVSDRQPNFSKGLPSQAAIIATFLQDELAWEGVDRDDMYTVYSVMGWESPGNPGAQLNNAMSRNKYFGSVTDGKYLLSHKGENYARHGSLAKDADV